MELTFQQRQAVTLRDPIRDLLISAAAGSGKTSVLVERLLSACASGTHIDKFLIITYTRAAAGELRGRIQKELLKRRRERPDEKFWGEEMLRLHRANIGTIHAFCSGILRDNAVEAGVRPDFRQLEGEEENATKTKALDNALERLYSESPLGFGVFVDSLSDVGGDRRVGEVILSLYNALQAHPYPDMWMDEQLSSLENGDPWGEHLKKDARRTMDFAAKLMGAARRELRDYPELDAVYGSAFDSDLVNIKILKNDINAVISRENLKRAKKTPESQYFQDIRNYCKKLLNFGAVNLSAEERAAALLTARGIFCALRVFTEEYKTLKNRKNALDFSDLEHITHALLKTNHNIRFAEVLVDEYQDVNQVQEDIIRSLRSPVFMVGDVRQSVYGFRQAEPGIFLKKYNAWAVENDAGARVILPHNFRSKTTLLNAVNEVFEKIMLGMEYGENEKLRPAPGTEETDTTPRAVLVYCDKADLDGDEQSWKRAELEASMCAGICAGLVGRGEKKPEDIAVLLRSKSDMGIFKRALSARGLPSAGQEDNVYQSLELQVALAYLQILDNPRQDIPIIAVMRSPLYNFSPDELTEVRSAADGDFYDALAAAADDGDSKCGTLWSDLAYLRAIGSDDGVDTLFRSMLERLGMLELFGDMPDGELRRDNLMGVIPLAASSATVSELCAAIERLRDGGQAETSAVSRRGVTLMTMHKSKGLEFDTVIVADLAREFNRTDTREPVLFHKELGLGLKYTDSERRYQYSTAAREAVARRINEDMLCEETRLMYVALTRAKERLYVTLTIPDFEKRLTKLAMGLDGKPDEFQLLSAKNMSDWMLLALMKNGKLQDTDTWQILRWSPEDIEKPEHITDTTAHFEARPHKQSETRKPYAYAASAALPSKLTVTELNPPQDDNTPAFAKPRFMERHVRMSAAERGTALHAALQYADLSVCADIEGVKSELARMERERRLTPEQAQAAEPAAVCGFVNSALGRRALASEDMRREFAFSLLTPADELIPGAESGEKILLQGVIDLLFYEPDGWVIVDFKTNRLGRKTPKYAAAAYGTQLKAYAGAVERMTGKKVSETVIYFLDGQAAVVV